MQKHNDAIKTSGHSSFRKIYHSLYWKGCVWGGVGDRTELQHIDPHSYGHNSVSFPFSWAARPWVWGPSLSGTRFLFQHLLSNCNCSIWGLEGPLCWVLVLSTASYLQLIWTSCRRGYIIIWRPLFFLRASQFRTQFNPSTVQVISWYSSTGCTCYLHRCISYFDSLAGSEVNMQQHRQSSLINKKQTEMTTGSTHLLPGKTQEKWIIKKGNKIFSHQSALITWLSGLYVYKLLEFHPANRNRFTSGGDTLQRDFSNDQAAAAAATEIFEEILNDL